MAREHHLTLLHPRLVRERADAFTPSPDPAHLAIIKRWRDAHRTGKLRQESARKGSFLSEVFHGVLGYRDATSATEDGTWELEPEKALDGGKFADAALGWFRQDGTHHVVAPVEIKGATQSLDHARGTPLTPVQQAWDYANRAAESRWIVVSNFGETRLYAKAGGLTAYERFDLDSLESLDAFRRFRFLLHRDTLLPRERGGRSVLDELFIASQTKNEEITRKLYAQYRTLREDLFAELRRRYSAQPAEELLSFAQTLLDRVLFVAFAEDRGLMPADTLRSVAASVNKFRPEPIWNNFEALFRWIDQGNDTQQFPAYNGGLFRHRPEHTELGVTDEMCRRLIALSDYDFREDVSVEVLGHVFEQSVTDLEALRRAGQTAAEVQATAKAGVSKRSREGIFYTPSFITQYLVRETLGRTLQERFDAASQGRTDSDADTVAAWEAYKGALHGVRVLDPSCGSGAFLVAAFDALSQEYERVNRTLAEFDTQPMLRTAFSRQVLNENLYGVDLNGESVEITRLSLWLKTAERGQSLAYLDRNIRVGNSVVSDPMVTPRAFDWASGSPARTFLEEEAPAQHQALAAEIAQRWREGFDVVIGNPPYVRQEMFDERTKEHWKQHFRAYDGMADLFVYFFERGLSVLRPGGRLGFIVSNKWLKGGYAEKLRKLLASEFTLESLIDFGHAPIFEDADAFPCIVVVRKQAPPEGHTVRVTRFPRELLGETTVAEYTEAHAFALPQSRLAVSGWTLDDDREAALMQKLRDRGTPLKEYAGCEPYYGIKTGLNEAFVIDTATKERLCAEDPGSAKIIRKLLRGQGLSRWSPDDAEEWLLFVRRGIDIRQFPAVEQHLTKFRQALQPMPADWQSDAAWLGRKRGAYQWWELQDAVDYFEIFDARHIAYPDILWRSDFARIEAGTVSLNTAYVLPCDDSWLLAVLNSPAMWWYQWRTAQHGKDEALRMFDEYVVRLPIPVPTEAQRERVHAKVEDLVRWTAENQAARHDLLTWLRTVVEIPKPGNRLESFELLNADDFVAAVTEKRGARRRPGPGMVKDLLRHHGESAAPIRERSAKIAAAERAVARTVHEAWGLDPDDLRLMWDTAPPRMPAVAR